MKKVLILSPKQIRRLRKYLGESRKEFAKRFGVSHETVAVWERGVRKPKVDIYEQLEELAKTWFPEEHPFWSEDE